MRTRQALLLLAALAIVDQTGRAAAAARYDPSLRFRSLTTPHFTIHYHQGEEEHALRLARIAEDVRAVLVPRVGPGPRGRTHVVLVDQDDEPNGWATPIPYPLIELRLTPPEGSSFLGNTDDWLRTVFAHEYAHVLHLGQSRGWARIPRALFGRMPLAYPNLTLPLWQIEGLATWEESRGGDGRVHAGDFRAVVMEAARTGTIEPLDRVNGGLVAWPDGTGWYAYGALFHEYLARRFGEERLSELSRRTAGRVPYFTSGAFKAVFGASLGSLWRDFERDRTWRAAGKSADANSTDSLAVDRPAARTPKPAPRSTPGVRRLTHDGYIVAGPRFDRDGSIVYSRQGPHEFPSLERIDRAAQRTSRVTSRYRGARTGIADEALYFDQLEIDAGVALKSDLYRWDRVTRRVRRLTHGARLLDPDVSPDGRTLAAVQIHGGSRRLVLFDRAALDRGSRPGPLIVIGGPEDVYSAPRFAPDGRHIAAERHVRNGGSSIAVVDVATGQVVPVVESARGRNVTPSWSPDGRSIVFASDRDGGPFVLYRAWLDEQRTHARIVERLGGPAGGAHSPDVSADGRRIVCVGYTASGFDVFEMAIATRPGPTGESGVDRSDREPASAQPSVPGSAGTDDGEFTRPSGAAGLIDAIPSQGAFADARSPAAPPYRPWSTLWPRAWLPVVEADDEQVRVGAATGGSDALGYHAWSFAATWPAVVNGAVESVVRRGRPDVSATYVYDRWRPSIYAQYSDSTTPLLIDRLTPAERPVALRERSVDIGASLALPHVRVSQAVVAAWHRERVALEGPLDDARLDRGALRVGWLLRSAKRYGYSISPEGGIALGLALEADRPAFGAATAADLVRLDARAYVPVGPRHGVLALRASAAGTRGGANARVLRLGGTGPDGAVLAFDEDATSLLRGFPYATFRGTRVALANFEYRLPLWFIERGAGTWPLFVRTLHAAGFFDAGDAWTGRFQTRDLKRSWGAEVSADVVLGYVLPVTATAGVAWGHDGAGGVPDTRQVYGRLGLAF